VLSAPGDCLCEHDVHVEVIHVDDLDVRLGDVVGKGALLAETVLTVGAITHDVRARARLRDVLT
jgi:hypothetical protein